MSLKSIGQIFGALAAIWADVVAALKERARARKIETTIADSRADVDRMFDTANNSGSKRNTDGGE